MFVASLVLSSSLLSCNPGSVDWRRSDSRHIHLYSRPDDFSKNTTHSDSDIQSALLEQETYIEQFEKTFNVKFDGMISIYLYNTDEVNVAASPGGGYSDPSTSTIYYRFFPKSHNINGTVGPMGGHEIFHILVGTTFGTTSSRLLSEGGAVWFDGAYSSEVVGDDRKRKSTLQWMREYSARGALKAPSELSVDVSQIEEGVFYPQAGFVVRWIVDNFGLETYTKLLQATVENQAIENALRDVYGMSLDEVNRLGAVSSFGSFDEWSDSSFGKEKTLRFYDLVKAANMGLLSEVLGLSAAVIDSEYAAWVGEYLKKSG